MQRLDDAHARAEHELAAWVARKPDGKWRVLLVKDVLAKLRVVLWCPSSEWESTNAEVDRTLREAATVFWSGSVLRGRSRNHPDGGWQEEAWRQAGLRGERGRLRVLERRLGKTGWFEAPDAPPWSVSGRRTRRKQDPAIALFYSFKGGAGRSTALAAAALQLAAAGERVADDLESTDAPHVPVVLPYEERLATFRDLHEIAEPILLGGEPYQALTGRLRNVIGRFRGSGR